MAKIKKGFGKPRNYQAKLSGNSFDYFNAESFNMTDHYLMEDVLMNKYHKMIKSFRTKFRLKDLKGFKLTKDIEDLDE